MSHHGAEVLARLHLIDLDLLRVTTDDDVTVLVVLEEVDAEDLVALEVVQLGELRVVDRVTELRVDRCCQGGVPVFRLCLLGNFPDGERAIVTASHQELLVLVYFSDDTRDGVCMVASLR